MDEKEIEEMRRKDDIYREAFQRAREKDGTPEPTKNRLLRNIKLIRELSDEQIRLINIHTNGRYVSEQIYYWPDENSLPYCVIANLLPPQDKWVFHSKYDENPTVFPNPIYDKAMHIIATLSDRIGLIPRLTDEEDKRLKEAVKSCDNFSDRAFALMINLPVHPENHPIQKAVDSAYSTFRIVRERALDFVTKYQTRKMTEDEYNYFNNCGIEKFIDDSLI